MDKFDPARRYWGFEFSEYYPAGGLWDLCCSFASEEDGIAWVGGEAGPFAFRQLLDVEARLEFRDEAGGWSAVTGA